MENHSGDGQINKKNELRYVVQYHIQYYNIRLEYWNALNNDRDFHSSPPTLFSPPPFPYPFPLLSLPLSPPLSLSFLPSFFPPSFLPSLIIGIV